MVYLLPLTIFFILYAIITRKDLKMGIFLVAFLLPSYLIRFNIGPLPSTTLEGMIIILGLAWLWRLIQDKQNFKQRVQTLIQSRFFYPGLLLIIAAGLSIIWATDTRAALGIFKAYFVEPFLIYLILIDQLKTKQDWYKIFYGLGAAVIYLGLLAIAQRITGWWSPTWQWTLPDSRRVTGLFTSPNSLGLFVGPVTALYIAWMFIEETRSLAFLRMYRYVVIAIGSIALLLAVSRGAIIALLATITAILFVYWSKKWTSIIVVVGLVLLCAIPTIRYNIFSLATFKIDSGQSRLALYNGTWGLLKQDPIQGLGLASFADRFEAVRSSGFTEILIYPHNIFLNFWSETGVLGLIALLWIIYRVVAGILKSSQSAWGWLFVAALMTMLVHGLIDVPYFKNDLAILSWIMLAGFAVRDQKSEIRKIKISVP